MAKGQAELVGIGLLALILVAAGAAAISQALNADKPDLIIDPSDQLTIQDNSTDMLVQARNNKESEQRYEAVITSSEPDVLRLGGNQQEEIRVDLGTKASGLETEQQRVTLHRVSDIYDAKVDVEIKLYEKQEGVQEFGEEPEVVETKSVKLE